MNLGYKVGNTYGNSMSMNQMGNNSKHGFSELINNLEEKLNLHHRKIKNQKN